MTIIDVEMKMGRQNKKELIKSPVERIEKNSTKSGMDMLVDVRRNVLETKPSGENKQKKGHIQFG